VTARPEPERQLLIVSPVPRVTLRPEEAAEALGVSRDYFDEHIAPELKAVRRSRGTGKRTLRLYQVCELERWAEANAARVLE
jgi:hypothetical protein